jgi:apolipoprotein N-acyltransferase
MKNTLKIFFQKYYYLFTGLLIFLSFPVYDVWFLKGYTFFAWFSLIPLLIYTRKSSYKEILFSSFIAGFIGNFFVYFWLGDFGANVGGGSFVIQIFMSLSLTVYFITKIIASEYLSRKFEKSRLFIYPSVWIFIDWIESIGFLAFPWVYWGYSQFQFMPFMQFSGFTGIMGITFILVLSNNVFADFIFKNFTKENFLKEFTLKDIFSVASFKQIIIFISIILIIIGYGQYVLIKTDAANKRDMRIAVIQSCISPWENWNQNRFQYLEHLDYYTKQSLKHDPDILIWSESATLETISYHYANGNLNEFERRVLEIARSAGKPLVTGEIGIINDFPNHRRYPQNNAVLIDGNGKVVNTYAKINLVPFGEWFPYNKWFPFLNQLLSDFGASNFVPGRAPLLFESLNRKFGVLICYEGIFYRLCREYKNLGSEFLINITNLGWTDKYAGHIQQFAASRFRAVENGIWFVSSSNTGITALIDPYGRIINAIPRLDKGFLVSEMDFDKNHRTFYSVYGDIILYAAMIFIVVLLAILLCRLRLKIFKDINI